MAQQINLLTPILLTPKRVFSALTLLQATGLLLVVGLLATLWMQAQDRRGETRHQALLTQLAAERQSLTVARAALPAPLDAGALRQQLQAVEGGNAERRLLLQSLGAGDNRAEGRRHSDLLALVARSLPEPAWLNELRYAPGRLELIGGTLDTAVLRPWLARLAAHPLLAGQDLAALRVERPGAPGGETGGTALLARGGPLATGGLPLWTFRVVSAPAQPASAASGAAR